MSYMIPALGILLWTFMAAVFVLCVGRTVCSWSPRKIHWIGVPVVIALLAILLLRPEEAVEAGEDAAAYFNAAASYVRHGGLRFSDSGLAAIPAEERFLFRYGHAGFLRTKDHVLWAHDEMMTEVGPHFFPGYSILLAVPMALGFPYGAFWVSPLLAIMTGVLVSLCAIRLTGSRWLGAMAFALYILNPIVVWNARCLRAEWPASFLVMAGIYLWLNAALRKQRVSPVAGLLSGLALSAATLFHITAMYVWVPAVVLAVWSTKRSRFWLGWWVGGLTGSGLFMAQLFWITDPYWILDNLWVSGFRVRIIALVSLLLMLLLSARWGAGVVRSRYNACRHVPRLLGGLLGVSYLLMVFYSLGYRTAMGSIPGFPQWTANYLSLTDFEGVQAVWSRTALFFALLGLTPMCACKDPFGRVGRWLFLLLGPASATIGWTVNYMFETRRMVTFLVPFLTLASVCLIGGMTNICIHGLRKLCTTAINQRLWTQGFPALLACLLILAGYRGREHLFHTWNYRGAYVYYASLADEISREADLLLAEYTQTAVPVERLSGVPALPMAWGYRTEEEYRAAERVIERLVRENPERKHMLITPFQGAVLPGLISERLFSRHLNSQRLGRARRQVPGGPYPFQRTLHVYRVTEASESSRMFPYQRLLSSGDFGFSGSANRMPNRTLVMPAVRLEAQRPESLADLFEQIPDTGRLELVLHVKDTSHDDPEQLDTGTIGSGLSRHLGGSWYAEPIELGQNGSARDITIMSSVDAWLVEAFLFEDNAMVRRVPVSPERTEEWALPGVDARWMRAAGGLALPVDAEPRWLWFLASVGHGEGISPSMTWRRRDVDDWAVELQLEAGWCWYVLPLAVADGGGALWHDVTIEPAWNPEQAGYPHDLGILMHRLFVH